MGLVPPPKLGGTTVPGKPRLSLECGFWDLQVQSRRPALDELPGPRSLARRARDCHRQAEAGGSLAALGYCLAAQDSHGQRRVLVLWSAVPGLTDAAS